MRRRIVTWDRNEGRRGSTLYVNEQAPNPTAPVDYKDYDTFISHKGDDTAFAERAGEVLHRQGVAPYLDRWDPQVDGDSPELEEYLRDVIRDTPSILAVITENTRQSWWVPFEIGVGRETDSQIATSLWVDERTSKVIELPSYLANWPILATPDELAQWAYQLATSHRRKHLGRDVFIESSTRTMSMGGSQPTATIGRLVRSGKVEFVR